MEKPTLSAMIIVLLIAELNSEPVAIESTYALPRTRFARASPTIDDRPGCKPNAPVPPNRVDTTQRLANLRSHFASNQINAYIITSDNAHQSEMVHPHDHRREFISGFSGSAGTAVVTDTVAALWTDGRYFLQAEDQLDCSWILMKDGNAGVPNITNWLKEVLTENQIVAADPTLIGYSSWLNYQTGLGSIEFKPLDENLIDKIWTSATGRPDANKQPAFVHPLIYSGKSKEDKAAEVRAELSKLGVDAMVVTALDEVAWLLNIRGHDVPDEPVALGYTFINSTSITLFAEGSKFNSTDMKEYLSGVGFMDYNDFVKKLPELIADANKVLVPSQYVYNGGSSFAVYNAIPDHKRFLQQSPVLMIKAKKNQVEVDGLINAHIRDAVALVDFVSLMTEEVPKGVPWDELKVVEKLKEYRAAQNLNKGSSFDTIAGFGPNGAIVHYSPTSATNANITTSSLFLLDSGGQYLDGTTDITRTFHFGEPTYEHKRMYTLVLKGHVQLAKSVFPKTAKESRLDILARGPLYENGLDFLHGTGHGIGSYLGVHEGPTRIGIGNNAVDNIFQENYFFSNEPGYYKDQEFGIRIENIHRVVARTFSTEFSEKFYSFEAVTLVPYERKLILVDMLDDDEIEWINRYYTDIREKVGPELQKQNRTRGYQWLINQTEPLIKESQPTNKSPTNHSSNILGFGMCIALAIFSNIFLSVP